MNKKCHIWCITCWNAQTHTMPVLNAGHRLQLCISKKLTRLKSNEKISPQQNKPSVAPKSELIPQTLHWHLHLDSWVGVVVAELKIRRLEVKDAFNVTLDHKFRERSWFSFELFLQSVNVVEIDVCITECVHELTGPLPSHLGHHVRQQGVASNVEWHTQAHVGWTLVELTRQLILVDIELC